MAAILVYKKYLIKEVHERYCCDNMCNLEELRQNLRKGFQYNLNSKQRLTTDWATLAWNFQRFFTSSTLDIAVINLVAFVLSSFAPALLTINYALVSRFHQDFSTFATFVLLAKYHAAGCILVRLSWN